MCLDLGSGQYTQCAGHDAPIKSCAFFEEKGALVTASWDKTIKYWDARASSQAPVMNVYLPERVYSMAHKSNLMVVSLLLYSWSLARFRHCWSP